MLRAWFLSKIPPLKEARALGRKKAEKVKGEPGIGQTARKCSNPERNMSERHRLTRGAHWLDRITGTLKIIIMMMDYSTLNK